MALREADVTLRAADVYTSCQGVTEGELRRVLAAHRPHPEALEQAVCWFEDGTELDFGWRTSTPEPTGGSLGAGLRIGFLTWAGRTPSE